MAGIMFPGQQYRSTMNRPTQTQRPGTEGWRDPYNPPPGDSTYQGAESAARAAGEKGLSASTSYTDPSTGISYNYRSIPKFDLSAWSSGGAPTVEGPAAPDTKAAEAAAFARAKEKIGLSTQGAIKSLKSLYGARGLAGSGMEAAGLAGAAGGGQGQIGETIREQAIGGLKRAQDVADMTYGGNLQIALAKYQAEQAQRNAVLQAALSGGVRLF